MPMKSEERIIELLAEYLQKTDQILDQMKQTDRSVGIMSRAIAAQDVKYNEHAARFNEINLKFNEIRVEFQSEMKQMKTEYQSEMKEIKTDIRNLSSEFQSEIKEIKTDIRDLREDQGIMLKELVSISKRFSVVESKLS